MYCERCTHYNNIISITRTRGFQKQIFYGFLFLLGESNLRNVIVVKFSAKHSLNDDELFSHSLFLSRDLLFMMNGLAKYRNKNQLLF